MGGCLVMAASAAQATLRGRSQRTVRHSPYFSWAHGEEQTSDLVLEAVRRAKAGDRDALGFLYMRYADNVHGYVRRIVHDSHEAEDLTQQVFAKLMHVIVYYEEREVPFFAWMLRVARNLAIDHIRRERSVPVEEVYGLHEHGDVPAKELCRHLKEALSMLPIDQREVLVLRHLAGLTPPEIAKVTGRTEGSIHGLHHRGRRALRAELASRGAAPTTLAARRVAQQAPLRAAAAAYAGLA